MKYNDKTGKVSNAPTMNQSKAISAKMDKASVKNTGRVIKEMPMMKVNTGVKNSTPMVKRK